MYGNSCAVMAVEAWRKWNEFPDQAKFIGDDWRFQPFGDLHDVLDEIGLVMSHLAVSPVLDDSFIVQNIFTLRQCGSSFLRSCLLSALMVKYGENPVRYC